jgi:RHS repeat-associated protein
LFTSLSDFNSFLGGLGLPQLAGTGGVISIGGVEIGWGEIAIGVLDPEVVISIAAVAGAVAIWDYYQTSRLNFATYWQDSASGLDYANNRYYSNAYGRFMTPDPYKAKGGGPGNPRDPQSWNRYTYTSGDPVNRLDPTGLLWEDVCDFDGNDASCGGGFGDDQDSGGGGQGGGGVRIPPLNCYPIGSTTQPGQFYAPGTTTGGAYFGDPIELGFGATGGTGSYTFWVTQTYNWVGTVTYDNGGILTTVSLTNLIPTLDGLLPGQLSGTAGINAVYFYFHDGPGIKTDTNLGTAVAFNATFYASATGWVSDGGDYIPCGTYNWTATFTWPLGGMPSGQSTVTSVTEQ